MTATPTGLPSTRDLPLAPGGDLDLRLGASRLRLRVVDGDRVVIRGHTDHDLERDVEIASGEGWVRVTDGPAGSLRVGPLTLRGAGRAPDLDVDVPRGVRISARTLSGDIEAVGVAGASRWQSASGDIRIGAEGGPVTAESVSGRVLVDARGAVAVTARTVSGAVSVRAPMILALDAATTSGDILVDGLLDAAAAHSVSTVSGDTRLVTGSEVRVEFQSVAGDIRAAMPHRSDGTRGRRTVIVGGGTVRIAVRTMSGDARLQPAVADPVPAAAEPTPTGPAPAAAAWADVGHEWADLARDLADTAKGWASRGASWASGATSSWAAQAGAPAAPAVPWAPGSPAVPGAPAAPAQAASPVPESSVAADPDASRLEILRALERGEVTVAEAADRLAALEGPALAEA